MAPLAARFRGRSATYNRLRSAIGAFWPINLAERRFEATCGFNAEGSVLAVARRNKSWRRE